MPKAARDHFLLRFRVTLLWSAVARHRFLFHVSETALSDKRMASCCQSDEAFGQVDYFSREPPGDL